MAYQYQWDVTAGDTDYSGRIYTPAAVDCMCRAIELMLIDVDLHVEEDVVPRGIQLPVVHTAVDYLAQFGSGDRIDVHVTVSIGETSLVFQAVGHGVNKPVFEGETVMATVDEEVGDAVSVPDWIRDSLVPYERTG